MTRPSLADYGTHDESAFPHLWEGVVGAWCPSLGPTGLRLHDFSRRANWGTLTNMDAATDWVVDGGQYALNFDGVDDIVNCGTGINAEPTGLTISAWVSSSNWSSAGGLNGVFAAKGTLDGDATSTYALYWNTTLGWTFFTLSAANVLSIVRDNTTATANKLFHIVGTATASTLSIYVDGQLKNTAANSGGNIKTSTHTLNLGSDGTTRRLFGNLFDLAIGGRPLSATEIAGLYQIGIGGIYERRRRTRLSSVRRFQAGWARGSNVILQPCGVS